MSNEELSKIETRKEEASIKSVREICGIVMPISEIDGCSEAHWLDVRQIIEEAVDIAGFQSNLVSDADEIGIIQKRIIQNLYENPLVVCDVSAKNPNVMFELGLRLAFDKPTIIIKDDKTSYSFDTSPIEHITYPRDLRFGRIVDFKQELSKKLKMTYSKAKSDTTYTTFLKHFGTFTVAKLDSKEISKDELILEELRSMRLAISRNDRSRHTSSLRDSNETIGSAYIFTDFHASLKETLKELGLRSKTEIRSHRNDIARYMERGFGPRHFSSQSEYMDYFERVFNALYGG